jgi:photosystem II stability/assembly factor-like uncharacterized protein
VAVRTVAALSLVVVAGTIRGHTEVLDETALRAAAPAAFGFFTPQRGLVSTADGHLLLTTDGGRSWRPDGRPRLTAIDVVSARGAYALRGPWLVRTDDGGATWVDVRRARGSVSFADRLHGWIDDSGTTGILATDDGGRTVRRLHVPCRSDVSWNRAVSRVTPMLGFLACAGQPAAGSQLKSLYVTHDAGRTWRLEAGEKHVPDIGYLVSIAFTSARDGAMTATRGGAAVTHDGGRTWRWIVTSDFGASVRAAPGGWFVLAGGLFRTDESGRRRSLLYPHSQPGPMDVSFSTPRDGIGIGWDWTQTNGQLVVATHDGGRTWQLRSELPPSYTLESLARADRDVVYLVAISYRRGGEVLLRSTDEGRTWQGVATPRKAEYFSVSFPNPSTGVLGDDKGRFYVTRNLGRTWTEVHGAGEDLRTFSFLTPMHGFALSTVPDYVLRETTDGGRTWHRFTRARLERPIGLTTLGFGRVWIADASRSIVRSSDGGRTWQRIELNSLPNPLAMDFVTPSVGYAPVSPFSPYRTSDGGRTWKLVR